MNNILNSVLENLGDQGVEKIATSVGLDKETASSLMKQMGPVILAKMGRNTESHQGLVSLDAAISKDHDGSIFNKVEDLANQNVDTKGGKIMDHIFGGSKSVITKAMASKAGVSKESTNGLMEMMGPLVLGQLGKMKSESTGFDIGMLQNILGKERESAEKDDNNMLMGVAKMFLDKDNDGSITDDLMNMAKGFLK